MNRREALKLAAAIGASLAWKPSLRVIPGLARVERRDLFPEGVASGDPHPDSVLLWTRRPPVGDDIAAHLTAQIATDASFAHIVAEAKATVRAGDGLDVPRARGWAEAAPRILVSLQRRAWKHEPRGSHDHGPCR